MTRQRLVAGAALLAILLPGRVGGETPPGDRRSDTARMSSALQAMQADDAANPGMLAVLDGEALWNTRAGTADRSCADCHGDAAGSMRGVAARYPAWNARLNAPVGLAGQINQCRTVAQGAAPLPPDNRDQLALTAFVAHQSRGLPIHVPGGPGMDAARRRGAVLFDARVGQLNLACASCHGERAGSHLAGTTIPQAHPVGYPIYRLEWQAVGSLQRRLRNCMAGVRAEPYPDDAPELVDIEAFLMGRADGLPIETPAVRP